MLRLFSPKMILVHLAVLHLVFLGISLTGEDVMQDAQATQEIAASAPMTDPVDDARVLADSGAIGEAARYAPPSQRPGALQLDRIYEEQGHYHADLGNGWVGELTTDIGLQKAATRILNRGKVPFGAVVVLDVATGDVLAMADRFDETHEIAPKLAADGPPHLALRALAPAASIFKVITGAGLLETGVSSRREYPFLPAKRRLYEKHLTRLGAGAPKSDLGDALAKSNNGFIARMADKHLTREDLSIMAQRFGFGRVVPFALLTDASTARVPRNRLERARMAAGFWHTRLTPLHGALIATAVAGDGTMPQPRLVRQLKGPDDRVVDAPDRAPFTTAMTPKQAKKMRQMMARTTRTGTGRRAWKKWPKSLAGITVGGKTGSLAKREPYTYYTWFVGFAPAENPQIAIAVMVGNGELWWQRATDIARDTLAWYFLRAQKRANKNTKAKKRR